MESPGAKAIATARIPGIDVARSLAILGMVLVNFKLQMDATSNGPDWLVWLSERLDGRAAALFVVLAGLGVSLRSRRAREDPTTWLRREQVALLQRAVLLFLLGLLNLHMWEWDILHFYGVYLALAALVLRLPSLGLWALAAALAAAPAVTASWYYRDWGDGLWSPAGMLGDLFLSGLHPVVPWFAFLLVGMWLGRQPLADAPTRRRILVGGTAVMVAGEGTGLMADVAWDVIEPVLGDASVLLWAAPRPPSPAFVVAGAGTATVATCACIEVTQSRAGAGWVLALVATGQLAFTWYIVHAIAILVPLQHGLFSGARLWVSVACSLAFFAAAVAASVWWRRRYPHGPLEGLIRQITGRTTPAPWGGRLA